MSNQLGTGQEEDRQQKHQSHAQLRECCLLPIGSIAGSVAHSSTEQPSVMSVGDAKASQCIVIYHTEPQKQNTTQCMNFPSKGTSIIACPGPISYHILCLSQQNGLMRFTSFWPPRTWTVLDTCYLMLWLKWLVHCIVQTILLIWCTSFTNIPIHNELDTHITNGGAGFLASSICRLLKMSLNVSFLLHHPVL